MEHMKCTCEIGNRRHSSQDEDAIKDCQRHQDWETTWLLNDVAFDSSYRALISMGLDPDEVVK